jgi:DNA-binding response OmpR family regulator
MHNISLPTDWIYVMPRFQDSVPSGPEPPTILLVEEDARTRSAYAEFLRHQGYQVDEAVKGREGIDRAAAVVPDVITTEWRLDDMDGSEMCRELSGNTTTEAIPVIVLTGRALLPDVVRAREAHWVSVLAKPCPPEVLLREIQRVLSAHERRLRPTRRSRFRGGRRSTDMPSSGTKN